MVALDAKFTVNVEVEPSRAPEKVTPGAFDVIVTFPPSFARPVAPRTEITPEAPAANASPVRPVAVPIVLTVAVAPVNVPGSVRAPAELDNAIGIEAATSIAPVAITFAATCGNFLKIFIFILLFGFSFENRLIYCFNEDWLRPR